MRLITEDKGTFATAVIGVVHNGKDVDHSNVVPETLMGKKTKRLKPTSLVTLA